MTSHGIRMLLALAIGMPGVVVETSLGQTAPSPAASSGAATKRAGGGSFFGRGNLDLVRRDTAKVRAAFKPAIDKAKASVVRVHVDGKQVALGSIVAADGLILTKASQLTGDATCRTVDGKNYPAKIAAVDEANDLALLRIDAKGLTPIDLPKATAANPKAGQWAISVGTDDLPVSFGVVSGPVRKIPLGALSGKRAVLGILLATADDKFAKIAQVTSGGPAEKAGLKAEDIIAQVDGKAVEDAEHFRQMMSQRKIGEAVTLAVKRGMETLSIKATLGDSETSFGALGQISDRQARMNQMGGALSQRRGRFPAAYAHDSILKPEDCGGPVVDLGGNIIGVNLSRTGRTESHAIPVEPLRKALASLMAKDSKSK